MTATQLDPFEGTTTGPIVDNGHDVPVRKAFLDRLKLAVYKFASHLPGGNGRLREVLTSLNEEQAAGSIIGNSNRDAGDLEHAAAVAAEVLDAPDPAGQFVVVDNRFDIGDLSADLGSSPQDDILKMTTPIDIEKLKPKGVELEDPADLTDAASPVDTAKGVTGKGVTGKGAAGADVDGLSLADSFGPALPNRSQ
jgi:hypothetical protein